MNRKVLFGGLLALLWSASNALAQSVPDVRFSEIHYDNTGTDAGEAIEVSGPAGTDISGWQIVLYNGNGGGTYTPIMTVSGAFPATCGARGVMVFNYPVNGIQNGDPDGFALVDATGSVIEFLSYEGTFTATNGPASGRASLDIGVREAGTEPVGLSLARTSAGNWSAPAANTFGICNDDAPAPVIANVAVTPLMAIITVGGTQQFNATAFDTNGQPLATSFTWTSSAPAVASVNAMGLATGLSAGDTIIRATAPNGVAETAALRVNAAPGGGTPAVRFSEIHYDNVGTDVGEAIEIEGPAGTSLDGVSVVLYDGTGGTVYNTMTLSGTIQASCGTRGVFVINYPVNGIQNGSPDGLALVAADGSVIEFLSYEGAFTPTVGPAAGLLSTDILAAEGSASPGQSLMRDTANVWTLGTASFGTCNVGQPGGDGGNRIQFSGRLPGDVPLPVGFQDQIFAALRNSNMMTIPSTFTFSSDTPSIATIDQRGVVTALAPGMAILRATAADGTTGTNTLPTRIGIASTTANYAGNAQFGEPTDADPSDDFLVRYPQFTTSYSALRSTPNWVSYVIDATTFGPEDRCDCFSPDPQLPAIFPIVTTADYTGAGGVAGFGIDRGHMVRSFDRTAGSLDNANTFYFTNIVPQAADQNQGPWSALEIELGNRARFENNRVFVIAGPAGNKGTVKNEGKIVIPTSTFKIAVILPQNMSSLNDIRSPSDLQIIAVNMPNDPGIRNVPWQTYQTTVDEVERISGYDTLQLLADSLERLVETNNAPPEVTAQLDVSKTGLILNRATGAFTGTVTLTNTGMTTFTGPMQMYFDSLPSSVRLLNAAGKRDQSPFITMQVTSLAPGQSIQVPVQFSNPQRVPVSYTSAVYAGQFQ
jgi:DNA/RNA endonuclease G (NUC1)